MSTKTGQLHIVIGNISGPNVTGKGLSSSTPVIFLSLVFWGWVPGPIGMILSAPMISRVKIVPKSYEETQGLAIVLGSGAEIEQIEGSRRQGAKETRDR